MIKGNGRSTGQTNQAERTPDVKEIHVWQWGALIAGGAVEMM
jgi:hypothetical protein